MPAAELERALHSKTRKRGKAVPVSLSVPLERARAHWWQKQGLSSPAGKRIDEVIAATGWLRTLGGVEVYIAARARLPSATKQVLEQASEALVVQVVPAVRGCIYLLPRAHVPLALKFAESIWQGRAERDLERTGSSWKEVSSVARAALEALKVPLGTDALRKAMPVGAVRSFGERGKKVGLSSALPVALRQLEFQGEIVRTLEAGRLDTERYVWRKTKPGALSTPALGKSKSGLVRAIAEIFFRQMGPATAREFADWAGISLGEAKAAISELPLSKVAIPGYADEALVLEDELEALKNAESDATRATLTGFEDNYTTVHAGPGLITDRAHHGLKVDVWGGAKSTTLGAAKHLAYRPILVGDRLAGFWEYDPGSREIVTAVFDRMTTAARRAIDKAARDVEALIEELGHAHAFSLDTDAALKERAGKLRALAKKR